MGINDGVLVYYPLPKFNCAVVTVFTVPMSTRTLTAAGRRHNERARGARTHEEKRRNQEIFEQRTEAH